MAWAYGKLLKVVGRILKANLAYSWQQREGLSFGGTSGAKTFNQRSHSQIYFLQPLLRTPRQQRGGSWQEREVSGLLASLGNSFKDSNQYVPKGKHGIKGVGRSPMEAFSLLSHFIPPQFRLIGSLFPQALYRIHGLLRKWAFFTKEATQDRILTIDQLKRRGQVIQNKCNIYKKDEESTYYILIHYLKANIL